MPRQARLDAPGLVHHVMARGLNRQRIFTGATDYLDFLRRVEAALSKSPQQILAWALMPNHVHFLIRSGATGLSSFMRRLMTGYALGFNARHKRVGYLYQGRFKSLVCEEEEYLMALVRYIHVNPVSAGLVRSVTELKKYPYTGHSVLMGTLVRPWQEVDEILGRFGHQAGTARSRYEKFLMDGVSELRKQPTDLLGGGLLESVLESVRQVRRKEDRALTDSRVLGEGEFVDRVLKEARQKDEQRKHLRAKGVDIRELVRRISRMQGIEERQLFARGRQAPVSAGKAILIYAGVEYLGRSTHEMAKLTRMTVSAASKSRLRGEALIIPAKLGLA